MGMAALRVAAWKQGSEPLSAMPRRASCGTRMMGCFTRTTAPNAHHIDGLIRFESDLAYEVYKFLRNNVFPIVVRR